MTIHEIHIHYRKKNGRMYRRKIRVTDSRSSALQILIGRQLISIQSSGGDYYYVVALVRLPDSTTGFRTIIGKHSFRENQAPWEIPR